MSLMGKSSLFWSSPNFLILFLISFVLLYINFHWQMQSHEDLLLCFLRILEIGQFEWQQQVTRGCLFLKLCRKVFSLSPEYVVSLFIFINTSYHLEEIKSIPTFLFVFNHKECWIFFKCFFHISIDSYYLFFFSPVISVMLCITLID